MAEHEVASVHGFGKNYSALILAHVSLGGALVEPIDHCSAVQADN